MAIKPTPVFAIHLTDLTSEEIEMTSGVLGFLDVEAIEEQSNCVVVYHKDLNYLRELARQLLEIASWIKNTQIRYSERPDENWNKSWEASFSPIIIDDFCTIKATFHDIEINTAHAITIDPEMAFGTGHHETTFAMIQMMSTIDFNDKEVLDFGTGTGILAILAEKLAARSVFALDNDEIAIECANRCVSMNQCYNIKCETALINELSVNYKYDVILANINRNVLLESASEIIIRMNENGILLLSGILISDKSKITDCYSSLGLVHTKEITNGEWVCLQFEFIPR